MAVERALVFRGGSNKRAVAVPVSASGLLPSFKTFSNS